MGRPLKFQSVKELKRQITKYFNDCDKKKRPYTITGLALALDTTREIILDYENEKHKIPQGFSTDKIEIEKWEKEQKEFSNAIKKAKVKCENYVEEYLFQGKNQAGAIFNLKNNYKRWKDRIETDITSGGKQIKGFNYIIPKEDDSNNKTIPKTTPSIPETTGQNN